MRSPSVGAVSLQTSESEAPAAQQISALADGTVLAMDVSHPMTLRIISENRVENTVVRVEGRLDGEGVAELDGICRDAALPLRLELGALLNVDDLGLGLLRALVASGATVTGASPCVRFLLESESPAPPGEKHDHDGKGGDS